MDQQNNTSALNDSAGVLPMDTGATVNGIHDEDENNVSSVSAGGKKGRGRPPKSAGSTKAVVSSDGPKRGRGRPSKGGETVSPIKQVVVAAAAATKKEEPSTNGDASKKKRGRPSKGSTPVEQSNGINKPQVRAVPVVNYQEQDNVDEPAQRKRGRPSGSGPKKPVVAAVASASKESSPTKKRGRPSGSGSGKKPAAKPKAVDTANGSARKRGRPKKAVAASPTAVGTTPATETTTVTSNNV